MSDYVLCSEELYHHGIKGQKWGVRRFENEDGTLTPEGKIRYGRNGEGQKHRKADQIRKAKKNGEAVEEKKKNQNSEEKTHYSKDAQYFKDKGDKAIKELKIRGIVGTALGVAALAGVGYAMYKDEGIFATEDLMQLGLGAVIGTGISIAMTKNAFDAEKSRHEVERLAEKSEFKSLSDIPKATKDYKGDYFNDPKADAKELMDGVNPDYPNPGSNCNCMLCTSAMVMRLMGYDVKANKTDNGYESFAPEDWFSNCEVKKFDIKMSDPYGITKFKDALKDQGDGAYGNLMVDWGIFGGGHSILYAVKDGEVHFIDGQCGQEYPIEDYWAYIDPSESSYCRLDHAEPKEVARGLILRNG